jgi:hypothetical protein
MLLTAYDRLSSMYVQPHPLNIKYRSEGVTLNHKVLGRLDWVINGER